MDPATSFEAALHAALAAFHGPRPASRLGEAMAYALFPGGARLRPSLALAVASAAPDGIVRALPAAVALELLHGASLVHDDLPCFDNAALRRHKASVHRAFGEATAVLTGDALLALAFRAVGDLAEPCDPRCQRLLAACATHLMHGQALEQEQLAGAPVDLRAYHADKTGSLFEAAASAGALAADLPLAAWATFGREVGAAYQMADDLLDVQASCHASGKTQGRDALLHRPNFALQNGVAQAQKELFAQLADLRTQLSALDAPVAVHRWLADLASKLAKHGVVARTLASTGS